MRKIFLEKNLSGADAHSPVGAKWQNARCYPSYTPNSNTARLIWKDPSSHYYPTEVPAEQRVHGPYGTVVLIAPNIACSAGHCFDVGLPTSESWVTPYSNISNSQLMSHDLATLMSVQFSYELDCQEKDDDVFALLNANLIAHQFDIIKLLEHRNGGLDYAVFELSGDAGSIYGVAKIAIKEISFTVAIPQHPRGLPKKVGKGYAACADNQCNEIRHYVDTLGGSSGSGIFYEGFLIGIHTHGTERENNGVSMIALFKASDIIRDIVLKDSGLYARYHDASEFLQGFLLGAVVAGGTAGIYSLFQKNYSTSKKALITGVSAVGGGVIGGLFMDHRKKQDVIQKLSKQSQYNGLAKNI